MRFIFLLAFAATAVERSSPEVEHPKFDPDDAEAIRIMNLDVKTFDSRGNWIYSDPHREDTWKYQMEILGWK